MYWEQVRVSFLQSGIGGKSCGFHAAIRHRPDNGTSAGPVFRLTGHPPQAHKSPVPKYAIRATQKDMARFGAAVRARRLKVGLGLRVTALNVGISHGMMSHIEKGENYPSLQVYVELCRVLQLPQPALT